jgi:hypothetical protein
MKYVTIGYQRQSDGDIAVLATLNNGDDFVDDATFEKTVLTLVTLFAESTGEDVRAWERQDTPDYLDKDDDLPHHWIDVTPNF